MTRHILSMNTISLSPHIYYTRRLEWVDLNIHRNLDHKSDKFQEIYYIDLNNLMTYNKENTFELKYK